MGTSRFRIRNSLTPSVVSYKAESEGKVVCTDPLTWTTFNTGTVSRMLGKYENMDDVVTQGYRSKSDKGDVIMSPMGKSTYESGPSSGNFGGILKSSTDLCSPPNNYKPRWRYNITSGSLIDLVINRSPSIDPNGRLVFPQPLVGSDGLQRLISEASTQCLAQRGKPSGNLWETLAEINKISSIVPGLVGGALRTLSFKKTLVRRSKETGNAWLIYRYGLKPLISDMGMVIEGIQKQVGKLRITSRGSVNHTSFKTSTVNNLGAFSAYTYSRTTTTTETVVVRAMSLDEYLVSTMNNIGFSYKGLVTLPWELLPYSFVVDWFTNVGDFLNAIVPDPTLRQLGTCYTVQRSLSVLQSMGNFVPVGSNTLDIPPSQSSCVDFWTNKVRFPGISGPSLVIRSDFRLDKPIRAADAISLLLQKIR